jgi:FkbM family methyltransferase
MTGHCSYLDIWQRGRRATHRVVLGWLKHSVRVKGMLYRLIWILPEACRRRNAAREALKALADSGEPVFFVNIGSNDGLAGDPLREFIIKCGWSGILVEPVDYVFQRLSKAYSRVPKVILENVAIADLTGAKPFYYLRQTAELPAGYDQIGSFIKEHLISQAHMFSGLEKYLMTRLVPCMTLSDLLRKRSIRRVDVFLIDVEGYDHEILKQIDLVQEPPRVIIFESVHLRFSDREMCHERLRRHGYRITQSGLNSVAVLMQPVMRYH